MAGKGSAPRKGADQKTYEDNWEKIFGKKDKPKEEKQATQATQDKSSATKR